LIGFSSIAAVTVLFIVFDVAYHAWHGRGQACRKCGHVRQMKSFRVYSDCPNCGGA
jgi:hypothetical protein